MTTEQKAPRLIWGVNGIAAYIGRTRRQTEHMIVTGVLPARQAGRRWYASPAALDAFFGLEPAGPAEAAPPVRQRRAG